MVLTTWPSTTPVDGLARALVDERLAACVQVAAAGRSWYRWEGAVESADERTVAIKTTRAQLDALAARVRALHPYDVPEWLVLDVTGSEAYVGWIRASVGGTDRATS
jgi:periplasmic divalent cation tolerance protein